MKSLYYIIVLFVVCLLAQNVSAQTQTRTRGTVENNGNAGMPELSVRAKAKNDAQGTNIDNVAWLRVLYREIDLRKEENTPLYFPTQAVGDRMNLFTLMFKLLAEGKLKVYKYIDGREVFTEQYETNFEKDLLTTHHIIHKKEGSGATTSYIIDESDIPSNDVLIYYIKEANYFDQATGTFGTEILALCPMIVREGDFGENIRIPLFWVPYESIRPYISRSLIMTSNYNNALTYTTDDFFQLKMYKGEIIKTVNMMNHTLAEQFPDSALYKQAQDSIEKQLKNFKERLWAPKDEELATANVKGKKESKAKKETKSSARASRSSTSSSVKSSTPKSSSTKTSSSSSAKSVRRK